MISERKSKHSTPTPSSSHFIDAHVGQRVQLRRVMLGLTQKDLAGLCGVTFQQIQKYENAFSRIAASRLFQISTAMDTPVSFFFGGLPTGTDDTGVIRKYRASEDAGGDDDDPMNKNETLAMINLYWKLPEDQRRSVIGLMKTMAGVSGPEITNMDEIGVLA
ncbi:MAG: helix-turn-helix domain-containing protein [Rickettsiales bacterium]|jgi:transcriptional regulator with XRE-family HTH domain|nr:helix-turn-helix domain-containing protein [Rickettsiales bacterium]